MKTKSVAEILRTVFSFITAFCTAAILVLLFQISGKVVPLIPQAEATLRSIDSAATQMEDLSVEMSESLKGVDGLIASFEGIDELISSSTKMVEENTESISEALGHFNEIPFDDLSKAIKDLKSVVEPLANFTNAFR